MNTDRIAAVVVTRNRVASLRRCIDAVRQQTVPPGEIIVIDNQSGDGTADWLRQVSDVVTVRQGNTGSGGGQHVGIRSALDRGNDWVWCMDDDGCPAVDALEHLCAAARSTGAPWLNSIVLDEREHGRLAFGLPGIDHFDVSALRARGKYLASANPFNGTMLSRRLIEAIGLPFAELFIWGDEVEYHNRAARDGHLAITVVKSEFYHPATRAVALCDLPRAQMWKYYYMIRNDRASCDASGRPKISARFALARAKPLVGQAIRMSPKRPADALYFLRICFDAVAAAARGDFRPRYVP